MYRWTMTCLAGVWLLPSYLAAEDPDPTTARLERARASYQADVERLTSQVEDWFDKREGAARDRGDKPTVDQLKADRATFQQKGILPVGITPGVIQQWASARSKLEDAYRAAIKAYTQAKKDAEATAAEQALVRFRRTATGVTLPEWTRCRVIGRWRREHDQQVFIFEADGKVLEFDRANNPVTTGKWSIERDGSGKVPLANRWVFTFTLTGEESMSAPAKNPGGRLEGPWRLRRFGD